LLEERQVGGRTWILFDTLVGDQSGWFTDSFRGPTYDRKDCKSDFDDSPEALSRCLGAATNK
jgi:hypothetical protein